MRISYWPVLSFVVLAASPAAAGVQAGPITNVANGHIYYLLTPNTWTASETEAITLGGHLVTINDMSENQWVYDTFTLLAGNPNASLWLGLNDVAAEGQFVWANGEAVTFTYWYPAEPNNTGGNENFATIRPPSASLPHASWNDLADRSNAGSPDFPIFGVVEVDPFPKLTGMTMFTANANGSPLGAWSKRLEYTRRRQHLQYLYVYRHGGFTFVPEQRQFRCAPQSESGARVWRLYRSVHWRNRTGRQFGD